MCLIIENIKLQENQSKIEKHSLSYQSNSENECTCIYHVTLEMILLADKFVKAGNTIFMLPLINIHRLWMISNYNSIKTKENSRLFDLIVFICTVLTLM